jgi:hypothetical protein
MSDSATREITEVSMSAKLFLHSVEFIGGHRMKEPMP